VSGIVAVVRHGRAGDRSSWDRDDRLRPLDGKGQRQAMALIDQLEQYGIERVVSSPYLRCLQTVLPLAVAVGTEVVIDERLAEGGSGAEAEALLRELAGGGPVALCTHGDVVLALVGDGAEARKGSTWLLDAESLEPLEYLQPPS
jgi:broad specificity phosphatase PhoE